MVLAGCAEDAEVLANAIAAARPRIPLPAPRYTPLTRSATVQEIVARPAEGVSAEGAVGPTPEAHLKRT